MKRITKAILIVSLLVCIPIGIVLAEEAPPTAPAPVVQAVQQPDPLAALQLIDRAVGQLTLSREQHIQLQNAVRVVESALIECIKSDATPEPSVEQPAEPKEP